MCRRELLDRCIEQNQTLVVITKRRTDWKECAVKHNGRAQADWTWDWEGVGNSQKGEIK